MRGIYGSGPGGAGQRRICLKVRDTLPWARRATQRQNRKRIRRADFPGAARGICPKHAGTNIPPEINQHPGPCDCLDRNQRGQAWAGQQRCAGMPGTANCPAGGSSSWQEPGSFIPGNQGRRQRRDRVMVRARLFISMTGTAERPAAHYFVTRCSRSRWARLASPAGDISQCRRAQQATGKALSYGAERSDHRPALPIAFGSSFTPQRQLEAGRLHAWPRLLRPLICRFPFTGFGRKGRCRMAPDQPGKVTKKSCGLVSPDPPAEPGRNKGTGVMGCHPWGEAIRGEVLALNLLAGRNPGAAGVAPKSIGTWTGCCSRCSSANPAS